MVRKYWNFLSLFFFHHWYLAYIPSRKVEMGKVRWSSAFGFGQGFKLHSVFSRAHFTPFAPSTRRSPPWNHDILNFPSQTWSRGGQRLPGDNFCLQPKCSLPWTRIPSGEETKVAINQLREGCKKSKWKFKMAFAMKGGGVSRGSRLPLSYFEKWFF